MNNVPGFNEEYEEVIREYERLKDVLAEKSERLQYMLTQQDKLLRADYAEKVGNLEYDNYELSIKIARIRRKIALIQAAVNRKEEVDLEAIDNQLEWEYQEYVMKLMEMARDRDAAMKIKAAGFLNDEDSEYLTKKYKELVKKLHPDIVGKQSERQESLWLQLSAAYESSDVEAMRNLAILIDTMDDGTIDDEAIESVRDKADRMKASIRGIDYRIEELSEQFPFSKIDFLKNRTAVEEMRKKLKDNIEAQQTALSEYRGRLQKLKGVIKNA